jgi:hypothetical protein
MPEGDVIGRAREDEREGKSPSTQAGEFVREEIEHVREGKHGARSTKQAIAIGLSKARRAGVKLPPRKASSGGRSSTSSGRGRSPNRRPPSSESSRTRAIASLNAVRRERRDSVSRADLSEQAHSSARKRGSSQRKLSAAKAVRTKRKLGTLRGAKRGPRGG